ncbi:hypothetical protein NBRC116493_24570 [Aurantivibrio infirmus]
MSSSDPEPMKENNVIRRDDKFVDKVSTKIWYEKPSDENPYIAEESSCYGYNLEQLLQKRSYIEVFYLLFRGELPSKDDARILEKLMIAFVSPGPRHPGVRAAMNAGVGKTDPSHILPIGLSIMGGSYLGAEEVELSMRWLRKNLKKDPGEVVNQLVDSEQGLKNDSGQVVPGFGSRFEGVDIIPQRIVDSILHLPNSGSALVWGNKFAEKLHELNCGWYSTGVVAAVLCDLGFLPRMGPGIFQLISAPGLFAHGIELANKSINAMPFPDDEKYFIETEQPKKFNQMQSFEPKNELECDEN